MKNLYYLLFCLLFSYPLISQDTSAIPENASRPKTDELIDSSGHPADLDLSDEAQGLDREFYTTYFMMDPLEYERKESKARREENILRVFKKEISYRDPYNKTVLEEMNASTVKMVRVTTENAYIRKFKKRVTHLRLTEYMYIAKYKNYICLMFFEASPSKYYTTPTFVELVFPRKLLLE